MTGLIIKLLICIALSTFFSGMEIAFLSSSKLRFEMKKDNSLAARILSRFYRNANHFVSTMLVGNSVSLVMFCIWMIELLDRHVFLSTGIPPLLLLLIEMLISAITMVITLEFIPKTLFKMFPGHCLYVFAVPAFVCYVILYPISRLVSSLSAGILRISGHKVDKKATEMAFTKVDLDAFIQNSLKDTDNPENINTEIELFRNALDFSNIKARDCMIPRTEIIAVELDTPLDKLKETFIEHGISKVIVYKENIDNIVGYIHSSEMFKPLTDWHKNIRRIPIVPESMSTHKLMKLLMQQKRSLAVVVDEFGGTSGIVSMEDLVEEILGDIEDEHDTNSTVAKAIGENEYIFSGRLDIEKANEEFGLDLPESDEYQTIGGLILHEFQSFPKAHEVVVINRFHFKIIKVTATKIELVKLKVMPQT